MTRNFILLIACCILSATSYGQLKNELKVERGNSLLQYQFFNTNSFYITEYLVSNPFNSLSVVPSSLQTLNLAFFCRQELRFEKATSISFKFRLGSFAHVNYLEGKNQ